MNGNVRCENCDKEDIIDHTKITIVTNINGFMFPCSWCGEMSIKKNDPDLVVNLLAAAERHNADYPADKVEFKTISFAEEHIGDFVLAWPLTDDDLIDFNHELKNPEWIEQCMKELCDG